MIVGLETWPIHNPNLVTSKYLSITCNTDVSMEIEVQSPVQVQEVFKSAIVNIHQRTLSVCTGSAFSTRLVLRDYTMQYSDNLASYPGPTREWGLGTRLGDNHETGLELYV